MRGRRPNRNQLNLFVTTKRMTVLAGTPQAFEIELEVLFGGEVISSRVIEPETVPDTPEYDDWLDMLEARNMGCREWDNPR